MPTEVKRERGGERPERPVAHRLADGRAAVGRRLRARTMPGAPRSMRAPRQDQQQRDEHRARRGEDDVGVAPALRRRSGAAASGNMTMAPTPDADQATASATPSRRAGNQRPSSEALSTPDSEAPAEAHHDAEAEIEMPELGRLRGAGRGQRRGRHADDRERAQAEAIDDPAGDRRRDAADQQGEAVDQGDRAAMRVEGLLQAPARTPRRCR